MLHKKVFDDALILHEDLKYRQHLTDMLDFIRHSNAKNTSETKSDNLNGEIKATNDSDGTFLIIKFFVSKKNYFS